MKKILCVALCIVMLLALAIAMNAEAHNPAGGCTTDPTIKKANPAAVEKDGEIGEGEYEEVEINRDPETTDMLFSWNVSSDGSIMLIDECGEFLQDVHFYTSWDEVNGLNLAIKAKLLETPWCATPQPDNTYYAKEDFPGDEFLFQFGAMFKIMDEKDKTPVVYRGLGYNTEEEKTLTGHYGKHGYLGNYELVEGENYAVAIDGNWVTYEISFPINQVLKAKDINGNAPVDGATILLDMSATGGSQGEYNNNSRVYVVSLGDKGYCESKWAGNKLRSSKGTFSMEEIPYTPPHVHDYTEVVTEATCTEAGSTVYTCECGDSYTEEIEALGHDIQTHDPKAATCTEAGWEAYETCSRCEYTTYEEIAATGHDYTTVVTEPTCEDQGYTTYTCACGDSYVADYVDATGHDFGDWEAVEEATCTEAGSEKRACACGEEETRDVEALGHDLGEWVIDIEPTATTLGEKSQYCGRCGERFNVTTIPVTEDYLSKFTDLTQDWYKPYVSYVVANGYMSGTGDGSTFAPMVNMTRSMVVKVLHNIEGSPVLDVENPFSDVKSGWYYDAVIWASEMGIVAGRGDGTFDPDAPVSRQELAAFLYRYASLKGYDVTVAEGFELDFTDASSTGSWATTAVKWAVANGLISGKSANGVITLAPTANATRAEVAVVLTKFGSNVAVKPE